MPDGLGRTGRRSTRSSSCSVGSCRSTWDRDQARTPLPTLGAGVIEVVSRWVVDELDITGARLVDQLARVGVAATSTLWDRG